MEELEAETAAAQGEGRWRSDAVINILDSPGGHGFEQIGPMPHREKVRVDAKTVLEDVERLQGLTP